MALDPPYPFNHDFKAKHQETTIVIRVFTADESIIESLIDAFIPSLPPKLTDIFEQVKASIRRDMGPRTNEPDRL